MTKKGNIGEKIYGEGFPFHSNIAIIPQLSNGPIARFLANLLFVVLNLTNASVVFIDIIFHLTRNYTVSTKISFSTRELNMSDDFAWNSGVATYTPSAGTILAISSEDEDDDDWDDDEDDEDDDWDDDEDDEDEDDDDWDDDWDDDEDEDDDWDEDEDDDDWDDDDEDDEDDWDDEDE